jgi:GDP-4-dehydro-6-deoxy-D-mannose reductase
LRALITGINGFCGRHLARWLFQQGWEVAGLEAPSAAQLPPEFSSIPLALVDIRDEAALSATVAEIAPDYIFHLAGLLAPPAGPGGQRQLYEVNFQGTINLLEAARALEKNVVVQLAGSAAAYGRVPPEENPIGESCPFRPTNPYGVSKAAQDLLGYQYYAAYGLRVIRTRAFNVTGPGESPLLASSNFARQVAEIEKGLRPPVVRVGNLNPERDFVDARDAVRAYWLVALHGMPGEAYNVCSGQPRPIRSVLETLLALSEVPIRVEQDPARMRPSDIPTQRGDYSKLHGLTNWQPEITFEQTMAELLVYWLARTEAKESGE